jgi:hypothetical protein
MRYFALLRKESDSDFSVDSRTSPVALLQAKRWRRRESWREVLEFHIDGMLEDRLPIPPPSTLEATMADPNNAEALPFIGEVLTTGPERCA